MSDYSLYYFSEQKIDDDGRLILPIENFDSNLLAKSPYVKVQKDKIIAIENMDLPIEHDFKLEQKKPFNFKENFNYSQEVNDLIYFDEVKKKFIKNGIEIEELFIEMELDCSYAVLIDMTALYYYVKKFLGTHPYSNRITPEAENIKINKKFKVKYKLLKFKHDISLTKEVKYLEFENSKYVIKTKKVLDFDTLKTNNKLIFYIDENKTNHLEFPHIELNLELSKLFYNHVNTKLFHDYFAKRYIRDYNTVYLKDGDDYKKINMYDLFTENKDLFFKFTYNNSQTLSYIEGQTLFMAIGRILLMDINKVSLEARETVTTIKKMFPFIQKSRITLRDNVNQPFGYIDLDSETLDENVLDTHRFHYFDRSTRNTALDYPNITNKEKGNILVKFEELIIPAEIGRYLQRLIILKAYFKFSFYPITELNKKTQKHQGYFKDDNTHYCSITMTQSYKDQGIKMNSKISTTDVMFNEELFHFKFFLFFFHPLIPYVLKDEMSLQNMLLTDYSQSQNYIDMFAKPYYNQSSYFTEQNNCYEITEFSYLSSNIIDTSTSSSKLHDVSDNILKKEQNVRSTLGSLLYSFNIDLERNVLILKDLHFQKDNTKVVLPAQKDPYESIISKNYFIYFEDGDSISYPSNQNNNRKLFSAFNYDNQFSHRIGDNDFVTIKKKDAKTFTNLKSNQNIKQFVFEFRDTLGRPFKQIVKNGKNLPAKNILLSIGFDNFVKTLNRMENSDKILLTQYTFIHDNSEYPRGDVTNIEFARIRDLFPNIADNFDFANKYISVKLVDVSLPTKRVRNSDESSQYFVCVNGCSQANSINIDDKKFHVIGKLNISTIIDKWQALQDKEEGKGRFNFALHQKDRVNISFPFVLTNLQQINKTEIFIVNSKKQTVNYAIDRTGNTIVDPTTPFFMFEFKVYNNVKV